MEGLLTGITLCAPATEAAIATCAAFMSGDVPSDYEQFLRISDGGEGVLVATYLSLWNVERLIARNRALDVGEYMPGIALFGSDGGGEAFGFDMRTKPWKVVMIPFVGLLWEDALPVGDSFSEFLQRAQRSLFGIRR